MEVAKFAVQKDGEDDDDVMWSDRSVSVGRSESGTEHCAMSECPRQASLLLMT
jgi:hypothetical protein